MILLENMAVELCSENSGMSPRISFSHDLCHFDVVPVEQRPLRSKSSGLNSSIDFDFCVRESFEQDSSSADELFSEGKILPTEIKKKKINPPKPMDQPPLSEANTTNNGNSRKEKNPKQNRITRDETGDDEEKQSTKSFWGFKRSSSLNCGSGYGRSLCPLPLLSRSNSTGSAPNSKHCSISRESQKPNSMKHGSASSSYKTSYQKPPLRKSYKGYGNGNGVKVNPVILNVPSGNLFGLGSIFFNPKDKNHKKK